MAETIGKAQRLVKSNRRSASSTLIASALNNSVRRHRVASPVSAPLSFKKPSAVISVSVNGEAIEESTEQRERTQAREDRRKQELQLWSKYLKSRSESSRNNLWIHYQPLVRYIAERLKSKLPECIDVCDLMGSGNIGLQDAINKFNPKMDTKFETYCVPRIRGAILDSIRALDWVPRLIRNKTHQYERVIRELAAELHREPYDDEIAAKLNMNLTQLNELKCELDVKAQISVEGCSRNGSEDRDQLRLEMLENRNEIEPTRELQREEIRRLALQDLNSKERMVVEQYYFEGRSMKQIGTDLKLSESRICQIHSEVLELLKRKFRAYQDSCFIS
jgi:RNA polymerase sigma factor for flagellar operon FliA